MNKKKVKAFTVLAMVASLLATMSSGVFAADTTSSNPTATSGSTTSSSTSTPTPTPKPTGGSAYITAYNVVDGTTGSEILYLKPDQKALIAFTIVDERILDESIPTDSALEAYIHARVTPDNFTPVSAGDVKLKRRAPVGGKLSYTVSFNDTAYKGTSKTAFTFDIGTTDANQNSFQNAPLMTFTQNIAQASDNAAAEGETSVKPTIMVKSTGYGADVINAGDKFTLDVVSFNTSKSQAVSNVTTTIELPKDLTLAGGSNSVLTENVAAGGSFTNKFELMAQSAAETSIANVTVKYRFYVKGSDTPIEASQLVTVSIMQPDRFSFSSMEAPQELFVGEEQSITLGFVNKGKSILYNVSAEISGNIKNPGQQQFSGNLQAGTEGSVDFLVASETAGTFSGKIKITYEDINGKQTVQEKEYSITVSENMNGEMNGGMNGGMIGGIGGMGQDSEASNPEGMPNAGFPWWGWVIIATLVVAIIIATVVIIKKKKAKRLEAELAEDD